MAKAPRASYFLDSGKWNKHNDVRQAQRDVASAQSLSHIAATLDALLVVEQKQTQYLHDIASMMWEQKQQGQPRP